MTGNPQNILIASLSYDYISWIEFAANMLLPVTVATIINATMVLAYYAKELFPGSSGFMENIGIIFHGNRTPEMLAQEHAYYARKAAAKESSSATEVSHGWSIWSMLQALIIPLSLIFFALGFEVSVVSIVSGAFLMIAASCRRQYFDPKHTTVQYNDDGNALLPKKTYDMDGAKIEPEEEELVTESETTLLEVDYGLLMFGAILMVVASYKHQHFDPKPTTDQNDDDGNALP
jgi:hypothetical protein